MTGVSVCTAFRVFCLRSQNCSSDGNVTSSVWIKTWPPCDIPVDSILTSIDCTGLFSLILRAIVSLGSLSKRVEKSTALFVLPAMSAMVKLNCRTKSNALLNGDGIILF